MACKGEAGDALQGQPPALIAALTEIPSTPFGRSVPFSSTPMSKPPDVGRLLPLLI